MTRMLVAAAVVVLGLTVAAQTPATTPTIFARGIVSTDAPEFAVAFTPDGREVYFNRTSADRASLTILTATRTADGWSAPVTAPFSGTYRDVDPFVAPDGRRLYFSSDRPRGAATGERRFTTWYVERTAAGWGPPIDPGAPLNSEEGDVFVSAARDGTVVFTSSRGGASRVYTSRQVDGRWETPRALQFGSTTDGGNPMIAPSGRFIVMVRVPAGGSPDLFVSCRTATGWAEPTALSAVNGPFADFAPSVDADERTLSFTSERPGVVAAPPEGARPPGDIYRIGLAEAGVHCS